MTTPKTGVGEVPDYLSAQSMRPSAADIEWLCLLGSYRGHETLEETLRRTGSIKDSPLVWSTERLRETLAQQREHSLRVLKDQGVTDADIAWWEGLSEEERTLIKRSEFAFQIALLQDPLLQSLQSPEEKLRKLNKMSLCYADYASKEEMLTAVLKCERLGYAADDYPLPWQLQKRCKWFATRCFITFRKKWFKETAESFNTMNAFYRSQIRDGKI